MFCRAPRPVVRLWRCSSRGALLAVGLWLAGVGGAVAQDPAVAVTAEYAGPTRIYDHLVLGKDHNWSELRVTLSNGQRAVLRLEGAVFEDTAPRLVDLDGDGAAEVVVVESTAAAGARLAVYAIEGSALELRAATPPIGRSHRWLAPVGAADLDGDGLVELAYVDRPHLAKTLRVWRYHPGDTAELRAVAELPGVTNHRIGDPVIEGGIRQCEAHPEILLASGDWRQALAVRLKGGALTVRALGRYRGPNSVAPARACS